MVSKLLKDFVVPPDYTKLREEIENHEYAFLILPNNNDEIPYWYKICWTGQDCVAVEEVLLRVDTNRCRTIKVLLAEWETVFVEWIDKDHSDYDDCRYQCDYE